MPLPASAVSIVLAVVCWCAGCDTIHGVSRTIPLNTLPAPEAVEQAIRATPGVTEVTRRDVPPRDSSSLYRGAIHDPGFAQFACRDAASAFAAVEPKETSEGGKRLDVYCTWMNHVPSKGEVSNARDLIERICNSLHQRERSIPASSPSDDRFIGIKGH